MTDVLSLERAVEVVLERLPTHIRLGLPLGLGKPNRFVNALYARLKGLPERQLTIYTALCLNRPSLGDGLQRRFLEPFVAQLYQDYPDLDFVTDLTTDALPSNIRVQQFFMQPGSGAGTQAQQNYVSSNYSHAARDIDAAGLNLIAQLVAEHPERPGLLSLSCNPDITLDLLPLLQQRRGAGETILVLGQVHAELPYMPGAAELPRASFDLLIDTPEQSPLFSTPNQPVGVREHFIGLHASSLVRDGGTLQIGIGALGDAISAALLARQADNSGYRALLQEAQLQEWDDLIETEGGLAPFAEGLYGCSEMFVNGLLVLTDAGILRRRVSGGPSGPGGELDAEGAVLHGGFFLGPAAFYARLRELPLASRARFAMTAISYVNRLYGDEALKRTQRRHARFINTVLNVSLLGAATSDQLADGQVLSGVGGQFDFVVQGHELEGARSILLLRSWRESAGVVSSNILWDQTACTIPRHLRDIVVTEYGIADLRGKNDAQVIEALLNIADSRFQPSLLDAAQLAGKLPRDFRIAPRFTDNSPQRLEAIRARHPQLFPEYPLGSDFTVAEKDLLRALNWLKSKFHLSELLDLGRAALDAPSPGAYTEHLARMNLDNPSGLREQLEQRLLLTGLHATRPASAPAEEGVSSAGN
ncbi:acetyl-CoA hydrolase/transferase C-terminal domain-containing protein [Pseudomonas massiliensis]|uniref:acetyl-CoA hydrolase/transferase C-terminal domain-containing protein n=1 Tax=Pseudomonas massiliensis TaxID=522492 RepID=UPI0006943B95|nr:acetyl-CoA hydrolase/transferase C-terminal domain-containing protein [Pseudomonas massiliensis]